MIQAEIKVLDLQEKEKTLGILEREQFPFVVAKSLTQTAQEVQGLVQTITRKNFKLHSEFIPKSIRIKPALKGDVKSGYAQAEVYTTDKISFMVDHEEGNKRKARRRLISIPAEDLEKRSYKTATGRVKKSLSPSGLLNRKSKKAFIKEVNGKPMLMFKKSRENIEVMYTMKPRVNIKKDWGFQSAGTRRASKVFNKYFDKNMKEALSERKD